MYFLYAESDTIYYFAVFTHVCASVQLISTSGILRVVVSRHYFLVLYGEVFFRFVFVLVF